MFFDPEMQKAINWGIAIVLLLVFAAGAFIGWLI